MALSPDIVGMTYEYPDHYVVGREAIRQYAVAVKNDDPPPTSTRGGRARPRPRRDPGAADVHLRLRLSRPDGVLRPRRHHHHRRAAHSGRAGLKFLIPIKAGDVLRCRIRIDSLRRAFGADVLTLRSWILNQDGETVQEDYTTMAGRTESDEG